MHKVFEIYNYIDSFAPYSQQDDYDNSGLNVGSMQSGVTVCLLSLDVTPAVIKEAVEKGAELIISHHPAIFIPIKTLEEGSAPYLLAKHGISALSAHTNLDASPDGGVNVCLAEAIGILNAEVMGKEYAAFGSLSSPVYADTFISSVKNALGCGNVKYCVGKEIIEKVMVSSGAGGKNTELAVRRGADALITSDIAHHQFLYAAENSLTLIDAGHFNTENVVIPALKKRLLQKFPNIHFVISDECRAPYKWL